MLSILYRSLSFSVIFSSISTPFVPIMWMNCIKPIVSHQVQLQEVDILNFTGISFYFNFRKLLGRSYHCVYFSHNNKNILSRREFR
jgi:hypothetical protein